MNQAKHAARKRRLTELSVRKLQADAARSYVIWDTLQRGLAIRVQPTGSKAWKVIYSRHGRSRWLHLGDAGAIGLADARTLAARRCSRLPGARTPPRRSERSAAPAPSPTSRQRYVERYAKKRNRSWRQADALVRRFLLPRWGKLQAAGITRGDVRALISHIEAPVLANQTLAAASAIFAWAATQELVAVNPCRGVERNATRSRERVLGDSEVPRFWAAFDDAGLVISSALKMLLLTGQRPGEVAHMRREHIDGGWWQMPGEPVPALRWPGTKNKQTHRVWLPAPARALLAELGGRCRHGVRVRPARAVASMPPCARSAPASRSTIR